MAPRRTPKEHKTETSRQPSAVEAELARRRAAGFIPFTELGDTMARLSASVIGMHQNAQGDIVLIVETPKDDPGA